MEEEEREIRPEESQEQEKIIQPEVEQDGEQDEEKEKEENKKDKIRFIKKKWQQRKREG